MAQQRHSLYVAHYYFRDLSRSFQAIAKYTSIVVSVSGASQPTRTTVAPVSPDFLKVFGVQPILGRDFNAGDARKGADPTVLVSSGYCGTPRQSRTERAPTQSED